MAKVLVVVDYQNDFVDGALGFPDAVKLEHGIVEKINEYKANNEYVICTLDSHHENYLETQEGKNLPVPHCIVGTPGWELYGAVKEAAKNADAIMVEKATFGSVDLADKLNCIASMSKANNGVGITEVEVCGIVTNMCTISNAVICKAVLPEAKIRILANLCSSFDMDLHNKAIDVMRSMQMEIVG